MFSRKLLVAVLFVGALFAAPTIGASGIQDPTRPADYLYRGSTPQLEHGRVLQALLTSGERKIAIINGELLREGEQSQGIQVLKIDKHSVLIRNQQGKRQELVLTKNIKGQKR